MQTTHINPDPNAEIPLVEEEFWQGSHRLYILFAGYGGHIGIPPDLFFQNGGILDQSKLVLRDPYHAWFQRGLPTVGKDVYEVAEFLEKRIEASGAREVRFVGNCKGGFAALLFCSLLGRGRAIVTVPQTYLSPEKQKISGDPRGTDLIESLYLNAPERHVYDLRPLLEKHSPNLSADVYVATNPYDIAHARELEGFKNINITYLSVGGHRVTVQLHKEGRLKDVLAA